MRLFSYYVAVPRWVYQHVYTIQRKREGFNFIYIDIKERGPYTHPWGTQEFKGAVLFLQLEIFNQMIMVRDNLFC